MCQFFRLLSGLIGQAKIVLPPSPHQAEEKNLLEPHEIAAEIWNFQSSF